MSTPHVSKDPLHGVTLEQILVCLVDHYGWRQLSRMVEIRCFMFDPSISSSLKFLRRTPWARTKVEEIYVHLVRSGEGGLPQKSGTEKKP